MVVFDRNGKFVRSWGKEFRGVAHGLHIRREGRDEDLYLTVNAANPEDDAAARAAGGRPQGDDEGRGRLEDSGAAGHSTATGRQRTALRSATTPPISPSRRTATSMSATATDRSMSISTTARASTSAVSAAAASEPGQLNEPHGIWMDTAVPSPSLVVADRRNNRLQRFALDGNHIDFIPGFRLPCHFDEHKGARRGTRSPRPRHAHRIRTTSWSRTSVTRTRRTGTTRCAREPRDYFIPGQFICPHGACFDHDGNIFVVEWVEVGRVTKLRKVA